MKTYLDEGTLAAVIREADAADLDMDALSITDLATAEDVSDKLIVGQFNAQFLDPDTSDEKTWADKGKGQEPTYENFEVGGQMLRDRDVTGKLTTTDPLKLFAHREVVYFIIRPGVPQDVAWSVGQDYTFFKVIVTKRNPLASPEGGTEKIEIGTLPRGHAGHGTTVA